MYDLSLITIAYHRNRHLENLLRGVGKNSLIPDEIIVVDIDDTVQLPETDLNVRKIILPRKGKALPLARARNVGAKAAKAKHLVFLDVDCIPAQFALERMYCYVDDCGGIVMSNPYFLQKTVDRSFEKPLFKQGAVPHPNRPQIRSNLEECSAYELFWSCGFAISKRDFNTIGGFDTGYEGYGAEDTDFAFQAKKKGIPFYLSDAIVYHQPHKVYSPPLHHFDDIVKNCNHFYNKWKSWPMGQWLQKFKEYSLIDWDPYGKNPIRKLRNPDTRMLQYSEKKNVPFA